MKSAAIAVERSHASIRSLVPSGADPFGQQHRRAFHFSIVKHDDRRFARRQVNRLAKADNIAIEASNFKLLAGDFQIAVNIARIAFNWSKHGRLPSRRDDSR